MKLSLLTFTVLLFSAIDLSCSVSLNCVLVDADTNTDVGPIASGDTINLAKVGSSLSIRVELEGAARMQFSWTGIDGKANKRTENVPPFAAGGNVDDDYFSMGYLAFPGTKSIQVEVESNSGNKIANETLSFEIVGTIKYVLVDANTDKDLQSIESGETIDLAKVGRILSIRAELQGATRMQFSFTEPDGSIKEHTENAPPFAAGGNTGDDYFRMGYLAFPGTKSIEVKVSSSSGGMLSTDTISLFVMDSTRFDITLVNMGSTSFDPSYLEALEEAKARWESLITGNLKDIKSSTYYGISDWFGGYFGSINTDPIDDLLIGYSFGEIDGEHGTLGIAGCTVAGGNRCASGLMIFDAVDFKNYDIDDIKVIVLHEIGHILGLVSALGNCNVGCNETDSNSFTAYSCNRANEEYDLLETGNPLYLENNGGSGTACYHWDENSFNTTHSSELMTGYFERNKGQPISRVTIAALEDLGVYTLDYSQADTWPYTPPSRALGSLRSNKTPGNENGWDVIEPKTTFFLPDLMEDVVTIEIPEERV